MFLIPLVDLEPAKVRVQADDPRSRRDNEEEAAEELGKDEGDRYPAKLVLQVRVWTEWRVTHGHEANGANVPFVDDFEAVEVALHVRSVVAHCNAHIDHVYDEERLKL